VDENYWKTKDPALFELLKEMAIHSSCNNNGKWMCDHHSAAPLNETNLAKWASKALRSLSQLNEKSLSATTQKTVSASQPPEKTTETSEVQLDIPSLAQISPTKVSNDNPSESEICLTSRPVGSVQEKPTLPSASSCHTLIGDDSLEEFTANSSTHKFAAGVSKNTTFSQPGLHFSTGQLQPSIDTESLVTKQDLNTVISQMNAGFAYVCKMLEAPNLQKRKSTQKVSLYAGEDKREKHRRRGKLLFAFKMKDSLEKAHRKRNAVACRITSDTAASLTGERETQNNHQQQLRQSQQSKDAQKLENLSTDVAGFKNSFQSLQNEFASTSETLFKDFRSTLLRTIEVSTAIALKAQAGRNIRTSDEQPHILQNFQTDTAYKLRLKVFACKPQIESQTCLLTTKLDALREVIEELRLDAVTPSRAKRHIFPGGEYDDFSHTPPLLLKALDEANHVTTLAKKVSEALELARPRWKQVWESELQAIVAEQAFLKDHDRIISEADEDLADIIKVLKALMTVVEMQEREWEERKKMYGEDLTLSEEISRSFENVLSPEEIQDGYKTMLEEIKIIVETSESNSERRLRYEIVTFMCDFLPKRVLHNRAVERAEKLRKWENSLVKVNEFEQELKETVDGKLLKRTGGIEHIEKSRLNAQKQVWSTIFSGVSFKLKETSDDAIAAVLDDAA
jgi:hypothetical protein